MAFLGLLKINRVFRVGALITQANMDKNTKAAMKIFYFTFLLFIYIHLVGCMWFLVINTNKDQERRWVPPYDFIDWTKSNFFEDDVFRQYWVCLYYSVLIVGGNELGPSSDLELFFIVSANLIGAIVNAQIFGELAVLLNQLNRKGAAYQAVVDTANTAMENISLPGNV